MNQCAYSSGCRLPPERGLTKCRPHLDRANEAVVAYTARNRERLRAAKAVPCVDCGVQYPPYVMQFDHRDRAAKSFTIGRKMSSRSWPTLEAEIAKCDVVCANCHAERTHGPKEA